MAAGDNVRRSCGDAMMSIRQLDLKRFSDLAFSRKKSPDPFCMDNPNWF